MGTHNGRLACFALVTHNGCTLRFNDLRSAQKQCLQSTISDFPVRLWIRLELLSFCRLCGGGHTRVLQLAQRLKGGDRSGCRSLTPEQDVYHQGQNAMSIFSRPVKPVGLQTCGRGMSHAERASRVVSRECPHGLGT